MSGLIQSIVKNDSVESLVNLISSLFSPITLPEEKLEENTGVAKKPASVEFREDIENKLAMPREEKSEIQQNICIGPLFMRIEPNAYIPPPHIKIPLERQQAVQKDIPHIAITVQMSPFIYTNPSSLDIRYNYGSSV